VRCPGVRLRTAKTALACFSVGLAAAQPSARFSFSLTKERILVAPNQVSRAGVNMLDITKEIRPLFTASVKEHEQQEYRREENRRP